MSTSGATCLPWAGQIGYMELGKQALDVNHVGQNTNMGDGMSDMKYGVRFVSVRRKHAGHNTSKGRGVKEMTTIAWY